MAVSDPTFSYKPVPLYGCKIILQIYINLGYPTVYFSLGLGIFKGDGSNWIKPFRLRGCCSVNSDWESWTDQILRVSEDILKPASIFDTVCAYHETVHFSDEAFMAIVESFIPQTNTFIVANGEIAFTFKELSVITGLLMNA